MYVSSDITGVSTAITIVQGSTCPYIYNKGKGMHGGTSREDSTVNMDV